MQPRVAPHRESVSASARPPPPGIAKRMKLRPVRREPGLCVEAAHCQYGFIEVQDERAWVAGIEGTKIRAHRRPRQRHAYAARRLRKEVLAGEECGGIDYLVDVDDLPSAEGAVSV